MSRSTFDRSLVVVAAAVLAACSGGGPQPSPPIPPPSPADPEQPAPIVVTPTTPLPSVNDTMAGPPVVGPPDLPGTYQARLPAASSPGRLVTLELRDAGVATISADHLNGQPPIVRSGTWRVAGADRVALEIARPGSTQPERMVFRVLPDTLAAVEYDRAAYGSEGLRLVIVEHPFIALSTPGTWRTCAGCPGPLVTVTLRPDRTYLLRELYPGDAGGTAVQGQWSLSEDGQRVTLYGAGAPRHYLLEDDKGALRPVDAQGRPRGAALEWVEPMDENGQQASPGLAGTRWELTQLRGAPVRGQTRPTLEFGAEGRASGNTGCNSFFGQYESTGSAIDFGALGSTRRACLDEGANATEQSYLRALDAATRHEINGGVLTLYAGDEAVARFRRAASSPSR